MWVRMPDVGGVKIPERTRRDVESRIRKTAEENFKGKYRELLIRFSGKFCYVDALCEPYVSDGWPPKDGPESREEYVERLRSTPVHICRLRHYAQDRWGFGFFTYSNEKYEPSVFPDGDFTGMAEEAFLVCANVHLAD